MVGVFSKIGAIALNAVLEADVHVGEHVAVFGQGVPGLIAAKGRISLQPLVTHVFDTERADEAFRLLNRRPARGDVVQAVLKF